MHAPSFGENPKIRSVVVIVVVGFKVNCPLVGPEPIGGMPSVGVFKIRSEM